MQRKTYLWIWNPKGTNLQLLLEFSSSSFSFSDPFGVGHRGSSALILHSSVTPTLSMSFITTSMNLSVVYFFSFCLAAPYLTSCGQYINYSSFATNITWVLFYTHIRAPNMHSSGCLSWKSIFPNNEVENCKGSSVLILSFLFFSFCKFWEFSELGISSEKGFINGRPQD